MKKIWLAFLLFFMVIPLFSQDRVSLDQAISSFAAEVVTIVPRDKGVAVVAFYTNRSELMNYFFDEMIEQIFKKDKAIRIYERQRLENLQRELNFSLSGAVSDETAQRIGHLVGVGTVIDGSIERTIYGYRLRIRALSVETGQILLPRSYDLKMDLKLAGLLGLSESARVAIEMEEEAEDARKRAGRISSSNQTPVTSNTTLAGHSTSPSPRIIAVTNITGVPTTGKVGTALTLSGTVFPANATNKTIVWSVKSGPATISGGKLTASASGNVVVTATIVNGTAQGISYTKDFTIAVSSVTPSNSSSSDKIDQNFIYLNLPITLLWESSTDYTIPEFGLGVDVQFFYIKFGMNFLWRFEGSDYGLGEGASINWNIGFYIPINDNIRLFSDFLIGPNFNESYKDPLSLGFDVGALFSFSNVFLLSLKYQGTSFFAKDNRYLQYSQYSSYSDNEIQKYIHGVSLGIGFKLLHF